VFGGFLAATIIAWQWQRGVAVLCGLAGIVIATNSAKGLWQYRRLKRESLTDGKFDSSALRESTRIAVGDLAIPKRFEHFSDLILPRRLRMKRVFRALFFFLAFIAIVFGMVCVSLLTPPHKHPDDPRDGLKLLWIPAAILFAMTWSFLAERRRRKLLAQGEVAFAIVKGSNAGRSTLLPGIIYEFETAEGKKLEDFDHDWTDSFHEGMLVPVFYDPLKPENHVAMCASFYDIP
jgi:MFS family permease